jgi:hypothetical protein
VTLAEIRAQAILSHRVLFVPLLHDGPNGQTSRQCLAYSKYDKHQRKHHWCLCFRKCIKYIYIYTVYTFIYIYILFIIYIIIHIIHTYIFQYTKIITSFRSLLSHKRSLLWTPMGCISWTDASARLLRTFSQLCNVGQNV